MPVIYVPPPRESRHQCEQPWQEWDHQDKIGPYYSIWMCPIDHIVWEWRTSDYTLGWREVRGKKRRKVIERWIEDQMGKSKGPCEDGL